MLRQLSTLMLMLLSIINIIGQESWDFGDKYKAYIQPPSAPLRVKMQSGTSLKSGTFVSKVGGVAFLQVAEPDESLMGLDIKYDYINTNPDGNRLRIIANTDTVYPYIPDWQLIPIVKFANSEYNSCVSLFGPKTSPDTFDITYHPAFENTLIGIRLLQSDMALMDVETYWQLPTYNGQKILGLGEIESDKDTAINAARNIERLMFGNYQSWVFTDDSIRVKFSVMNDNLVFTGYPYYYFWRTDLTHLIKERERIRSRYESLENQKQGGLADKIILAEQEKLAKEYNNINFNTICDETTTNRLKDKYYLFLEFNQPVYSASLNVVHYSALFRYLKKTNSVSWTQFYNRVSSVHVSKVKTPTILPRRNHDE